MNKLRNIDVMIARDVFGWKVKFDNVYGWIYSLPDRNRWTNVPRFSSDLVCAWLVFERFTRIEVEKGEKGYKCWIYMSGHREESDWCKTAPLAICQAALRAIGVEVSI
ncbi:hypothetical protein BSNK01_12230 [Bacillaceae bacterium]